MLSLLHCFAGSIREKTKIDITIKKYNFLVGLLPSVQDFFSYNMHL